MAKKVWDEFFKKENNSKKFGKHIFDYSKPDKDIVRLVSFLKKERVKKILDLGCGNGRNSNFLAAKNFNIVGIDNSKLAIKKAKHENRKVKYLFADMKKLPFREDFFDAVISTQTIFHGLLKNIRKTIREIKKVTKSNGLVFITLQPMKGNKYRMGKKLEKGTYISTDGDDKGEVHHFFAKAEILKEFQDFDFIDFHLERNLNYWYILMRNKKSGAPALLA